MNTLKLTRKDFDASLRYIANEGILDHDGHVEIQASLGYVSFIRLTAKGYIVAQAGTGIEAGAGIEAGGGIEAGRGIEAGGGIKAGDGIKAGWGIKAGTGIEAGGGIKAGDGIKAGWGIKAGAGIEAGTGIEAGAGIEAGWYVRCKLVLAFNLRLFAGLCLWRLPNAEEMEVRCGKKEGGTVVHGNLIETGLPEEPKVASFSGKKVSVTVDGQTYTATID